MHHYRSGGDAHVGHGHLQPQRHTLAITCTGQFYDNRHSRVEQPLSQQCRPYAPPGRCNARLYWSKENSSVDRVHYFSTDETDNDTGDLYFSDDVTESNIGLVHFPVY